MNVPATRKLFIEDSYLSTAETNVIGLNESSQIILDQTNFYAASGGQPGDTGFLERADGSKIEIENTIYSDKDTKQSIAHITVTDSQLPEIGEKLIAHIDWDRRYKYMQLHSALHLMCALIDAPVTGGGISPEEARIDFVLPELTITKEEINAQLNELITENHPITSRWVNESQLDANPQLVRTMSVAPPRGAGQLRLVAIGHDDKVDLQPCGGTHVSETAEIDKIYIAKIENKGRQNRRFRLKFNSI